MELYLSSVNVDWETKLCTMKFAEDVNDVEVITLVLEAGMANSMAYDVLSRTNIKAENAWNTWKKDKNDQIDKDIDDKIKTKDVKIVRKYAWFPTKIKGKFIWLERYLKIYEYKNYKDIIVGTGLEASFADWILIGKKREENKKLKLPSVPWNMNGQI